MKNMKKTLFVFLILFLTMIGFAEQPVLVKEFVGQIVYVQGKVLQLAEAVPQSAYEWRPEEGVRSVSEVYLHIASSNYLTVTITGGTVPKETGFEMDFSKAHAWDTQTTDKTEIMEKVSESFETLKERVGMLTEEDLNREVEVFGMTMTIRNFMITMIGHTHEHLGQSIAYARTNHVTTPWSKKDSEG